jgi:hypothetical protein
MSGNGNGIRNQPLNAGGSTFIIERCRGGETHEK